jgi:integrase/recombinase XerD
VALSIDTSGRTEFVSGISIFGLVEGAPRPKSLFALRPRLAEIAPLQAALAAHFDEQLAELLQAKLGELHVKGLRWQYFCHMINIMTNVNKFLKDLEGAYAPNKLRSHYADARMFVDWCSKKNIEPLPINSRALCSYIEYLQPNAAYSSIRRLISSMRRLNKLLGFEDQTRTEDVYLAIRRLKRSKSLEQKQALGINQDILIKMIDAQLDTLTGIRNRALLSLGYDFLARRSELVSIRSADLKFTPDGALKGIIRKSKTDQYGKGRLVFGSERSAKLVRKWLRLKPQEIQPVFCAINLGKT